MPLGKTPGLRAASELWAWKNKQVGRRIRGGEVGSADLAGQRDDLPASGGPTHSGLLVRAGQGHLGAPRDSISQQ